MRNHQNQIIQHKNSRRIVQNNEFVNLFYDNNMRPKYNLQTAQKSGSKYEKFIPQSSESIKQNKTQQKKQISAQRFTQVTFLQGQIISCQSSLKPNVQTKISELHNNWQGHLNPISKITSKPFVRSKTCDQLRKQYSLKKQRKRNNSASKYNTPNSNTCETEIKSTAYGTDNTQNQQQSSTSRKLDQQKYGNKNSSEKIKTRVFSMSPYNFIDSTIQTFDQQSIKKLQNQVQRGKFKNKFAHKKQIKEQDFKINSQTSYPFKINTVGNKSNQSSGRHDITRVQKQQNKIQNIHDIVLDKFNPKLQRYSYTNQSNDIITGQNNSPIQVNKRNVIKHIQSQKTNKSSILINKLDGLNMIDRKQTYNEEQYDIQSHTVKYNALNQHGHNHSNKHGHKHSNRHGHKHSNKQNQKLCYQVEQEQSSSEESNDYNKYKEASYSQYELNLQDPPHALQISSSTSKNQLFTNLSLTNTILQQKLKLKQQMISQLNHNYCQLKSQLYHAKNIKGLNEHRQQQTTNSDGTKKAQQGHQELGFRIQIQNHSPTKQEYLANSNPQYIKHHPSNNSQDQLTAHLPPSPKLGKEIWEQFNRQRSVYPIRYQLNQQSPVIPSNNQKYVSSQNDFQEVSSLKDDSKEKQHSSSDFSDKITQQLQSQQLYLVRKEPLNNSRVLGKHTFKKSNFYRPFSGQLQRKNRKRETLIETLQQQVDYDSRQQQSQEENINSLAVIGFNQTDKNQSESMLLQSAVQKHDSSLDLSQQNLDLVSPIKNEVLQKADVFSYYHRKYANSPQRPQNFPDDSTIRFNYYLTPQKDQRSQEHSLSGLKGQNSTVQRESRQGLFQKAFSTERKSQTYNAFISGTQSNNSLKIFNGHAFQLPVSPQKSCLYSQKSHMQLGWQFGVNQSIGNIKINVIDAVISSNVG